MPNLSIVEASIHAADGTRIAYQCTSKDTALPALVIVNGPGADVRAWRGLIEEFHTRFRIISWDYRGFFRSEPPKDPSTLGPRGHAHDLAEVLDHLEVPSAVFIGWSLGVQVLLEFYRDHPERVEAIVSVNGTFGRPFDLTPETTGRSQLRWLSKQLRGRQDLLQLGVRFLKRTPQAFNVARRLGWISTAVDRDRFVDIARAFAYQDHNVYGAMLDQFHEHDAEDVLSAITCPTLLFAGQRDPLVPPDYTAYMDRVIPHAELLVIPIASHYIPIEFAEYLNLRIEAFLDEHLKPPRHERSA